MIFEYIWIDGNYNLRSKTRVCPNLNTLDLNTIPIWNYDGSSTNQATCSNSEVELKPIKFVKDPFRQNLDAYLVLCETFNTNGDPLLTNSRYYANYIFNENNSLEPWFGLEQEYFIIYPDHNYNNLEQGKWYCGINVNQYLEREITNTHLNYCLYSNLQIAGLNAEVAPYQWEFQIGPCEGIDAGDQLILARYILERIAEQFNVTISYTPKLHQDINGSGCHTNFSTILTRSNNGLSVIYDYINKLSLNHDEHIQVYGKNNHKRLTGIHETSSINEFTYGIGTRNTSIRIPLQVVKDNKGYFEDRRPGANIDPYQVISKIYKTCCL